jgi:hypothetical protein
MFGVPRVLHHTHQARQPQLSQGLLGKEHIASVSERTQAIEAINSCFDRNFVAVNYDGPIKSCSGGQCQSLRN